MSKFNSGIIKTFGPMTLERQFPVNVVESDRSFFTHLMAYNVDEVTVSGRSNMSVTTQGFVFRNLSTVKHMLLANDNGFVVQFGLRDLIRMRLFWPTISLPANAVYLVIHNVYSHTYYHWVVEALPRLFLLKDYIPSSTLLLPVSHDQKFHAESIKLFGVHDTFSLAERTRYVLPIMIASTQIGKIANYNPDIIRQMAVFMKSRISLNTDLGNKIYVSRSRALRRRIVNEKQVEECVKAAGFIIVHFEDYTLVEQISIMDNCRFFIGPHGAGLVNMIFMKPGGRVLELRKHDSGENYFYFALCNTVSHQYYYQFCDATNVNGSVQDSDIVVDIDKFKRNLNMMLK